MTRPTPIVSALLQRGVILPDPHSVWVGADVRPDRIAAGAVIHPGCRIDGAATSVGPGCVLGEEAPLTLVDCQLGAGVELKGGYCAGAVFLDGASMGSAAHVRPGTLLEEEASGAHAVGFKQTILLPFVTTGSLVNFCDVLMAGGTSRKNHSEVGSSYVHFNFTPHQDKATASLLGDVPRGVMLNQPPIFLGGQGGLVGPSRIAFGTVVPAGVVLRQDVAEPGQIVYPPALPADGPRPYVCGAYRDAGRIVRNNLSYIGQLAALRAWYGFARRPFLASTPHGAACLDGALRQLEAAQAERLKRLQEFAGKLRGSVERLRAEGRPKSQEQAELQLRFLQAWPALEARLREPERDATGAADREAFLGAWPTSAGSYLDAVHGLSAEVRERGSRWLQAVVDRVQGAWQAAPHPGG